MSFQVSALKFRPQRFDEVVGQDHVTETLKRGLQSDRVAHALLFCGPRGVGKTTIARILAKALNCENPSEDREPCNKCVSCESFNSGASFNIIELDAASNNKVEHIRQLVEQVGYPPQRGRYKVFIIDEVHMLSSAAFNAFLKTLEEPPPYAIFILATTEKHKILPTILSRCQIYDFKRIPIPDMIAQMSFIAEQENISFEKEALNLIAQKADGALRDALSLFDKINSVTAGDMTYQRVIKSLNVLDRNHFFDMVDWFMSGNTKDLLLSVDRILGDGFEGETILEGLQEHLREVLVCKNEATRKLMQSGERFAQRYEEQAALSPRSFIFSALNVLSEGLYRYKDVSNKRMHVELTLCKLAFVNHFLSESSTALTESPSIVREKKTEYDSSLKQPKIEEKKNISDVKNNTVKQDSVNKTEKETTIEVEGEAKPEIEEEKLSSAIEIAAPENPAPKPTVSSPPTPASTGSGSIPSVNLAALQSRIEKRRKQEKASRLDLNKENVLKIWEDYLNDVDSPSVSVVLKSCKILLDGEKIKVGTAGQVASQTVKMEKKLMEKLRNSFETRNVDVEVHIDPELQSEVQEAQEDHPQTPSQKLEYFKQKNEHIQGLVDSFQLKPVD
ncbi:MAG: DNA polymerase III subunit gamma/tau [Saprospirales bacterium]|nr:MAG: DNA polymerase III subunit gamma/tau [Saprospirales bacterium]